MQLSPNGLKLTETSEGCRLTAYTDTGGVWTIGYGHTGGVRPNDTITPDEAVSLLNHDIQYAVGVVNSHALPCTQGQFDALTDFVFNIGPTQFLHSTLLKYHLSGSYDKAAAEFPKWKYDNGRVIHGLELRRAAEKLLYTLPEQSEDRQNTSEQGHSVPLADDSAPAAPASESAQSSPAQPESTSCTAPASDSRPSGLLSGFLAEFHKLLEAIAAQRADS